MPLRPLLCHGEVIQRVGEELPSTTQSNSEYTNEAVTSSVNVVTTYCSIISTPVVTFTNASIPCNNKKLPPNPLPENGSSPAQNVSISPKRLEALSPGSHFINVLSDAISNDCVQDCSSNPNVQESPLQDVMVESTEETMTTYSTLIKSPDTPPIHQSQLLVQVGLTVPSSSPEIADVFTPSRSNLHTPSRTVG